MLCALRLWVIVAHHSFCLRFLHVTCSSSSFFLTAMWYTIALFDQLSHFAACEHLGCFHLGAFMSNAAKNMFAHVILVKKMHSCYAMGHIPMGGFDGHMITIQ